jgi:hypothetical protein
MFGNKPKVDLTGWKYRIEPTGLGSGSGKQWRVYITDPDGIEYGNPLLLCQYGLVYGRNIDKAEKKAVKMITDLEIDRQSTRSNTL